MGSGVEASIGGLGYEVPLKLKQFALQTFFADLDCRNDQNVKMSHSSPPDS